MSETSRIARAALSLACVVLASCSERDAPKNGAGRVARRAATVNAFVFADERFAAVLGPLPDPIDNPLWHRDRLKERLGLMEPDVEFVSLRLYRVESDGADPALSDLRLELLDGARAVEAVPLEVAPPRSGEDPTLRVLRARTLEPFAQARLAPGSGVEIWFHVPTIAGKTYSGARVTIDGVTLPLEPRVIEAERIAAVIERPTRESLRAMAVLTEPGDDPASVTPEEESR